MIVESIVCVNVLDEKQTQQDRRRRRRERERERDGGRRRTVEAFAATVAGGALAAPCDDDADDVAVTTFDIDQRSIVQ